MTVEPGAIDRMIREDLFEYGLLVLTNVYFKYGIEYRRYCDCELFRSSSALWRNLLRVLSFPSLHYASACTSTSTVLQLESVVSSLVLIACKYDWHAHAATLLF